MSKAAIDTLMTRFFEGISAGAVPEDILAPEMTFWSVSSGESDKERFIGGIRILAHIANQSIRYNIVSLTAEEDRVVAEIQSSGTLMNGETLENNHVFLFRLHDGKISSVSEYMNQQVVQEKIVPLMQEFLAKQQS